MEFYKYQGTGNDFVMIDNRKGGFDASQEKIAQICHRRFGVGADGLILIETAEGYDFRMKYYNADGAEGSMCGNGGRCAVQFAADLGIFSGETRFIAIDGEHRATLSEGKVFLQMIDVQGMEEVADGFYLHTGSPHLISFVKETAPIDVKTEGAALRYSPYWAERGGVNVNFVEVVEPNTLRVRTYERGVEDETYSCGTGVTAAAIAAHLSKGMGTQIRVLTLGGELSVHFVPGKIISQIILAGPAQQVFSGFL